MMGSYGFMSGFVNQPDERTKSFIFSSYRNPCYNSDHEVISDAYAHLWSDSHIKIILPEGFIEFKADKISGAADHVMKVAIQLPVCFSSLVLWFVNDRSCIKKGVVIAAPAFCCNKKWIKNISLK